MPISTPKFFQKAFAQNGGRQDVPITGDTSGGRASYDVGFPPVTRVPIVAGGIPPFGTDFNGVLYDLSSAIQYIQAGRSFPYNQEFADAIGGYGKGAFVTDPIDQSILYESLLDANQSPPPGLGWRVFSISQATTSVAGVAKIATSAMLKAGVNDDSFATAKGLKDADLWPLGAGQSWVEMTGSRVANTTYTNTTGRRIGVSVRSGNTSGSDKNFMLYVDNIWVGGGSLSVSAAFSSSIFTIVPAGSEYRLTVSGATVLNWSELR